MVINLYYGRVFKIKQLIENLKSYITLLNNPRICVAAGWYCAIGEDLRKFTNNKIISFDKDRSCKRIGEIFNKDSNIKFQTKDIENFNKWKVIFKFIMTLNLTQN